MHGCQQGFLQTQCEIIPALAHIETTMRQAFKNSHGILELPLMSNLRRRGKLRLLFECKSIIVIVRTKNTTVCFGRHSNEINHDFHFSWSVFKEAVI